MTNILLISPRCGLAVFRHQLYKWRPVNQMTNIILLLILPRRGLAVFRHQLYKWRPVNQAGD